MRRTISGASSASPAATVRTAAAGSRVGEQAPRGRDAVDPGHPDVHRHDVGRRAQRALVRLVAGGALVGFPAVLIAQDGRLPRLTVAGYAGTLAALLMLNLGEGVIEGFVKPYVMSHVIPQTEPAGFVPGRRWRCCARSPA